MSLPERFKLWLSDPAGRQLELLKNAWEFSYAQSLNGIGRFKIVLPPDTSTALVAIDRRIDIIRDGALVFSGLIRRHLYATATGAAGTADDVSSLEIHGPDLSDLLRRRIVAYAVGSNQADKNADYADDIMRDLVRENLGASAGGSRVLDATYFTVEDDVSQGPLISISAARKPLYDTLLEVADAARQSNGTTLYFGIVATPSRSVGTMQFRVRANLWGADRRRRPGVTNGVTLSKEHDTLVNPSYSEDWSEEFNYVYTTGPSGTSSKEEVTRSTGSLWSRIERYADGRDEDELGGLDDVAYRALASGRPRKHFEGQIGTADGARFGSDYNLGDLITAAYRGLSFDCIVKSVSLTVDGEGKEMVEATVERDDD